MQFSRLATVFAAAVLGASTSAFGAAGAITLTVDPPVAALSDAVTYRTVKLQTFVGLNVGDVGGTNVLLTNTGGNTINDVNITLSATVRDAAETLTLYKPEVYLPSPCRARRCRSRAGSPTWRTERPFLPSASSTARRPKAARR
jgi:hypothetical protein